MDGRSGRGVRALDGGFGRCVPMSCRDTGDPKSSETNENMKKVQCG